MNYEEQYIISDCLQELGMNDLALKVRKIYSNMAIEKYLSILIKTANKAKHSEVLERLYFAGLIYG